MSAYPFPVRTLRLLAFFAGLLVIGQSAIRSAEAKNPGRGHLDRAGQALASALEKQAATPWQGERLIIEYGAAGEPDRRWVVRDGVQPHSGQPAPQYFTTAPKPVLANEFPQFRAQIAANDTYALPAPPWMLGLMPGGPGGRRHAGRGPALHEVLGHFEISADPPAAIPNTSLTGTRYTVKPRAYAGGYVEVYVDQGTGLPAAMTRYGFDEAHGTHPRRFGWGYRALQANIRPAASWFQPAMADPQSTQPLDHGLLPPWGHRPPAGMPQEEAGKLGKLLPPALLEGRDATAQLPAGYRLTGIQPLHASPFPLISATFSDGLNPVTLYLARFPKGMLKDETRRRFEERLLSGPRPMTGQHQLNFRDNWLLLAAGEHEEAVLSRALVNLEHRIFRKFGEGLFGRRKPPPGGGTHPPGAPPPGERGPAG